MGEGYNTQFTIPYIDPNSKSDPKSNPKFEGGGRLGEVGTLAPTAVAMVQFNRDLDEVLKTSLTLFSDWNKWRFELLS